MTPKPTMPDLQRALAAMLVLVAVALFSLGPALGHESGHAPGGEDATSERPRIATDEPIDVTLLDLALRDQDDKPVRFRSEVVGDRIVVMDFIYTDCKTICPVLSQVMALVQEELDEELRQDVRLVSVSVDPATDTPARLKAHAEALGVGPGWLWLTGYKPDVSQVLDGLGVYTPDFTKHPGVVLVGDGRTGAWTRFYGFPSPDRVLAKIKDLAVARHTAAAASADAARQGKARQYFTDLPVVTHDGQDLRFFTDLLKDKVVLLSLFYTSCTGACPLVNNKLSLLQEALSDRLGKDIFFVSVTLDPETDTPEALEGYAANFKAGDGWVFVTGLPEDIRTITYRLGQVTDDVAAHASYLMVGDVKRAYWKKFQPNASNEILASFLLQLAGGG